METPPRVSTPIGTRTPRLGLGPGSRSALRYDPANLLRLRARRSTRTASAGTQPQPNGPTWTGGTVDSDSFPTQRRRTRRAGRTGTGWRLQYLRKATRAHASPQPHTAVRCFLRTHRA